VKRLLFIIVILAASPLYADWAEHGLSLVSTGPSSLEGAVRYELRDERGRVFHVNSPKEPDGPVIKNILKHRDTFFSWEHVHIRELSFYMYEKGLQVVVVPSSLKYRDTDLKQYLPAGFTLVEEKGALGYRYRVIVGNTSLKLDGAYRGEEPMLDEMLAYIRGIREGSIVVEDEKVVAGSVVSFSSEKDKGKKHVHPVGDLPFYDAAATRSYDPGKIRWYVSAQPSYLYPASFLGDIFVGGFGATASLGMRDLGISLLDAILFRFDLELMTGFWHLNEKKQKDSIVACSVKNAYVIPLGLVGRYRLAVTRNLAVLPSLGFGYYYNRLEYERLVAGVTETVTAREWNPSLMPGLRLDYRVEKYFFFAGAEYLVMFERRLDLAALVFSAGGGYMF
jgi:hypothetical protein